MFNMFRKKAKPKTPHIFFTLKFNLTAIAKWLADPQIIPPDDKWDSYAGYDELSFNITLLPNSEPFLFYHNDANEFSPHMKGATHNAESLIKNDHIHDVSWEWTRGGIELSVLSAELAGHVVMVVADSELARLLTGEQDINPCGTLRDDGEVIEFPVLEHIKCPSVYRRFAFGDAVTFTNSLAELTVARPCWNETVLYEGSKF